MIINIDLEDWKCENLLKMHGYISEEVTAFYRVNSNPYGEDNGMQDLRPIKIKVAYHPLDKPKELEKDKPMLSVLNDFAYDKVVSELYNSHIWELIVNKI